MGRELQKKKRRSGIAKVRQNSKSKKQIFGNAYIASQWNSNETLTQNYRRLGLTAKLNRPSGGVEKHLRLAQAQGEDKLAAVGAKSGPRQGSRPEAPAASSMAEVRIERDPETGAVRVVDDDGQVVESGDGERESRMTAAEKTAARRFRPLEKDAEEEEEEFEGFEDSHASMGHVGSAVRARLAEQPEAVRQLGVEALAGAKAPRSKRKQSEREREWCRRLVERHGEEAYAKMAKDAKLNPMQQSVGDIRKRVRTYLASRA